MENNFPINEQEEYTYGTPKSDLLKEIIQAGFKPLLITVLMCEETFVFQTHEEADAAAKMFLPEGWWYSIDEWDQTYNNYLKEFGVEEGHEPVVHWLNKE